MEKNNWEIFRNNDNFHTFKHIISQMNEIMRTWVFLVSYIIRTGPGLVGFSKNQSNSSMTSRTISAVHFKFMWTEVLILDKLKNNHIKIFTTGSCLKKLRKNVMQSLAIMAVTKAYIRAGKNINPMVKDPKIGSSFLQRLIYYYCTL